MAGSRDVRAGRAYVELGTRDSALLKGLKVALSRVRSFAEDAQAFGQRVALAGVGAAGSLVAVAKSFSAAGVELSKLRKQTGLGADALAGIAQAAEDAEVPVAELAPMLTKLQRTLAGGGKDAAAAFAALGADLEDIQGKPFADVLGLIADRLPQVADETQRVALATALFGRSGQAMLPVLERGSAGLDAAAAAAKRAGTAMDEEALAAAEALDESFDALANSTTGLRNAVGEALAPAVIQLVGGMAEAVRLAAAWVKQNPDAVRAALNGAVAVGAMGAAFAALGATILAVSSPLVAVTGAIFAIGTAVLAVTDTLGVTDTGFKELWNSIRVGGQGLGTWFTKLWTSLQAGWELFTHGARSAFAYLVYDSKVLAERVYANWSGLQEDLLDLLETPIAIINRGLRELGLHQKQINVGSKKAELARQREESAAEIERLHREYQDGKTVRNAEFDRRIAELRGQFATADAADPDDGQGTRFDSSRAKSALLKIGAGLSGAVSDVIGDLRDDLRLGGLAIDSQGASRIEPFVGNPGGAAARATAERVDVLGTFSAAAAELLGFGSSIQERQLKAAEETARTTRQLLDEVRSGGATFQ